MNISIIIINIIIICILNLIEHHDHHSKSIWISYNYKSLRDILTLNLIVILINISNIVKLNHNHNINMITLIKSL